MATSKPVHPIRRVRQALKATPEEMGLRQFATSAGFARFLGRSSSLIRNVECGITSNWKNLADLIERKTGVSSNWLLSDPKAEAPILDIDGRPWSPGRALDPFRPRKGMPDWRMVLNTCPGILPELLAEVVKYQLVLELSFGYHQFLENLVADFERYSTFENPALEELILKTKSSIEQGTNQKFWRGNVGQIDFDFELMQCQKMSWRQLGIKDMQTLLKAGVCGWANSVASASFMGGAEIIEKAKEFYAQRDSPA